MEINSLELMGMNKYGLTTFLGSNAISWGALLENAVLWLSLFMNVVMVIQTLLATSSEWSKVALHEGKDRRDTIARDSDPEEEPVLDAETLAVAGVTGIVLEDIVYRTRTGKRTHLYLECRSTKNTHKEHDLICKFCKDEFRRRIGHQRKKDV